jgi:hypothetical protein
VCLVLAALVATFAAPALGQETAGAAGPLPTNPQISVSFTAAPLNQGLANLLLLEQAVVIATDDHFYIHSPHDAGKMNPLTGLPFARTVAEESVAAAAMNFMLRNPKQAKLLRWTSVAFPVLERSIIGSFDHPWKTHRLGWPGERD